MISSLEVGSTFVLRDEASPTLLRITDALKLLNEQAELAKKSLTSISRTSFTGLGGKLDTLTSSMKGVAGEATKAADAMAAGFGRVAGQIDVATASLSRMADRMAATAAGSKGLSVSGAGVGGGRAGLLGYGGGGGHIITTPHVGGGGFGLGGGAGLGVAAGAWSLWESLKASADLQQVQENLRISGVSQAEIDKATQRAYDIGGRYGLTATAVLQGMNEIRNPLNKGQSADEGMQAAERHADTLARAAVVLRDQGKDRNGDVGRELYDLTKSAEFRNAISDKDFDKAVGSMVAAGVATGGIVKPREWLQTSQMLKSALPGLSDDYLYQIMPELMQEFGGSRAGTAGASLYQALIGGQMRTKGINLLADIGMVNKDKVEFNSIGMIKAANPGFFTDTDLFRSNPMAAMADVLEHMKAHGIVDEGAQRDYLAQLFGNRNAAQMAQTLGFQYGRLGRGAQGIRNTWDLDASSDELLKNNPLDQWSKFTSSLTNAAAALGTELMPSATTALDNLTVTVRALAKLFAGDFSWDTFKSAILGAGQPSDGGWFDKAQGWVYDHGLSNLWSRSGGGSPTLTGGGAPIGIRARAAGGNAQGTEAYLARMGYQYWRGQGLTDEQALSVLGNQRGENPLGSLNTAGGSGQFQWDARRRAQILAGTGIDVRTADYLGQQKAARWEMENSPDAINRVWGGLKGATTQDEQMGILVHNYERSLRQGSDIAIRKGYADRYRRLHMGSDGAAASPPVPGVMLDRSYKDQSGGDMDPSIHAHGKAIHVHTALHVDGKMMARVVQKHIVRRNQYVFGPSGFDGAAMPSGVDHGMAAAVSA